MPLLTRILKPEEFNAVTLAELSEDLYIPFPNRRLSDETEENRQACIDGWQGLLDALKGRGIIE